MTTGTSLSTTHEAQQQASTLTLEMLLHDLSAPVRHIQHFIDTLTESIQDPTPEQIASVRRIAENLVTARTLLQDSRLLLSYERHPVQGVDPPASVNGDLQDLASSFQPDFDQRGVRLSLDLGEDVDIVVDPKALVRIVTNLLANALKASPSGGTITLGSHRQGDAMVFQVSDTGRGFTREQADSLFRGWQEFDQGVNPPGIWGGLGLLICHSIVHRYGGQLMLASGGPGMGSTFSFGIPVAPAA